MVFPAASCIARRDRRASWFVLLAVRVVGMSDGLHMLIPPFWLFRMAGLSGTYVPPALVYLLHALPLSLPTIAASMIVGFLGDDTL